MCEKSAAAAALPCYTDDEKAITRLIDEEMRGAGLTIAADARALLATLIGGDRRASRNEIRKLALYAHGKKAVDTDDVFAVVADASGLGLNDLVDAAFAGQPPEVEIRFAKARAEGIHPSAIIGAALRQVAQLHRGCLAVDSGTPMKGAIPGLNFRREKLVHAALSAWTPARLEKIMAQFAEASLEARRRPALAEAVAHRALMAAAVMARRREG
jgi:DNA polymerase-3 subunit delta